MTDPDFALNDREFKRNHQGRPFIVAPDGKRTTYTRCTTFIGVLDDKTNLAMWQMRHLASYLVSRVGADRTPAWRELVTHAKQGPDAAKPEYNKAIRAGLDESGTRDRALLGTRIHSATQDADDGVTFGAGTPGDIAPYVDAYTRLTSGFTVLAVETPVVCDDLKVAGTPDRVYDVGRECVVCGLTTRIGDVKTGRVDAYTEKEQSMQLAVYAHSDYYDPSTDTRSELRVCRHEAVIVHLPADSGNIDLDARLVRVDIERGWELAAVAASVNAARKEKGLIRAWQ